MNVTPPVEPPPNTDALQTIQRRTWTRNLAIAVGAALLLVVLGWAAGSIANMFATPASEKALAEIEAAPDAVRQTGDSSGGVEGVLTWSPQLDRAVLELKALPAVDDDQEFLVWYLRDEVPQRAATFTPDDGATATVELEQVWQRGDVLQVTIEDAAGLSAGEPTGDVVLTIDSALQDPEPLHADTLEE
ncbi:anti-sigma factor [Microbacterium sp.]|uniref:anti-sigma factor n=1 Tax=Microbacterium sp. TaxID=51671 RepID=UPI003A895A6B